MLGSWQKKKKLAVNPNQEKSEKGENEFTVVENMHKSVENRLSMNYSLTAPI